MNTPRFTYEFQKPPKSRLPDFVSTVTWGLLAWVLIFVAVAAIIAM